MSSNTGLQVLPVPNVTLTWESCATLGTSGCSDIGFMEDGWMVTTHYKS